MRYADVLLIYAEAMIEQNLIDDSVLKAINMVRARAYGVNVTATDSYPAVTTTNQTELRRALRIEPHGVCYGEPTPARLDALEIGRKSIEWLQLHHAY